MSEEIKPFGTVELEGGQRVTIDETTPEVQAYIAQGLTVEAAIGNVCEDVKNGKVVIGVQAGQVVTEPVAEEPQS